MAMDAGLNQMGLHIAPPSEIARGVGAGPLNAPKADGAEFKRALDQVSASRMPVASETAAAGAEKLKFSNHAVERMRSRGISFQPETMKNIEGAVKKAAAKGSKDALILTGESALIVSVKNNTVVTVMDRQGMKDNVFTNIDSTVVI